MKAKPRNIASVLTDQEQKEWRQAQHLAATAAAKAASAQHLAHAAQADLAVLGERLLMAHNVPVSWVIDDDGGLRPREAAARDDGANKATSQKNGMAPS